MASRNLVLFFATILLSISVWSSRAESFDSGDESLKDIGDEEEQVMDPRLFLILPTGAGNLLNVNTTAALLALLGAASLLSALGFLIYHIVSSKLMSYKGQGSGGGYSYGGYGGSSGGYGSYGGGSAGAGGYGVSAGSGSHYGYARSNDGSLDWDSLKILDYISMMEEMWRKLDVKDANCQKRILCEIHQNEKALGPAASKIVNAFGYTRYLSMLNIPEPLKNMIDDYQDAADKGRSTKDRDCSELFDSCDFSIKETFLKKLKGHLD